MPKVFTSKSQKIGELGESIACNYLKKQGFTLVERNATYKWGEIDIIAVKDKKLYFIEVKAVSVSSIDMQTGENETFTRGIRPEENLNPQKMQKLRRTIELYLFHPPTEKLRVAGIKEIPVVWQFDLLCVYLDTQNKKAKVTVFPNVII